MSIFVFAKLILPYPCGLGGFVLLLASGMSVDAEGESCVVVAKHDRDGFDVRTVPENQGERRRGGGRGTEVFQPGVFRNALMQCGHGVRVVRTSGAGGGEEPGIVRVLGVLLDKQIYRFLWDGGLADGVLGLGAGHDETVAFIYGGLLVGGDGFVGDIQVLPAQDLQLSLADAAHQLRIEHGQGIPLLCRIQTGFQVLGSQRLHFLMLSLGFFFLCCSRVRPFSGRSCTVSEFPVW